MMGSRLNYLRRVVAGKTLMLENNPPQLEYLDTFQAVGGKVWPASELMVSYLTSSSVAKNANVLELGSGCGYVGIACAALGASHVTLTDRTITQRNLVHDAEGMLLEEEMPPNRLLLDICGRNITENKLHTGSCSMDVHEMQWGAEHRTHLDVVLKSRTHTTPYNLIIGSDVTYHAELSESLFWTVSELMKRSALRAAADNVDTSSNSTSNPNGKSIDNSSTKDNKSSFQGPATAASVQAPASVLPEAVTVLDGNNKLRFIVSHQHRLDSATALTLSTAKRFGLTCTTLATSDSSSVGSSSNSTNSSGDSVANNNDIVSTGTSGDTSRKGDSSVSPAGDYVLWQFTL